MTGDSCPPEISCRLINSALKGGFLIMKVRKWLFGGLALAALALLIRQRRFGAGFACSPGFFQCNEPTGILCAEQRDNPSS